MQIRWFSCGLTELFNSALFYGAYSLFQIHPVYVTFNVDRFTIVTAKDAAPQKSWYTKPICYTQSVKIKRHR